MGANIRMHSFYTHLVGDQELVAVEGRTVGECLNSLIKLYPEVKPELFDKKGRLHGYVEIYVNNESAYPEELKHPVQDGDEISIVIMAVGG